jgi:hypothetical protein
MQRTTSIISVLSPTHTHSNAPPHHSSLHLHGLIQWPGPPDFFHLPRLLLHEIHLQPAREHVLVQVEVAVVAVGEVVDDGAHIVDCENLAAARGRF